MTRRAIGWYEIDATPAEKIAALKSAVTDAAVELASLGVSYDEIDAALGVALDEATGEIESLEGEPA